MRYSKQVSARTALLPRRQLNRTRGRATQTQDWLEAQTKPYRTLQTLDWRPRTLPFEWYLFQGILMLDRFHK